jgi:hypothetical protein
MMGYKNRSLKSLKPWSIVLTLMLGVSIFFPVSTWGRSHRFYEKVYVQRMENSGRAIALKNRELYKHLEKQRTHTFIKHKKKFYLQAKDYGRNYRSLPPEEKARLKGTFREWQTLPQERKQILRRRMEKWRQLPPDIRERLQEWFQQWQKVPPNEQENIRKKLKKWNVLPQDEQEKIRRKFRRP